MRSESPAPVAEVPMIGADLGEKRHNFWKSMTQSKISEDGMGLNFVAPSVVNGENVSKLDKIDVDRLTESYLNSLIVYVIGKNPSLMAISNYCKSQWAPVNEPKIYNYDDGYFVVKMETEDRDAVLYSGPHLFFGKAMIVK